MIKNFNDIPEENKDFLSPYVENKNLEKSREDFVYLLKMFWQARFNKMSPLYRENFDWVCNNFLPENVEYNGIKFGENLISSDIDHTFLAHSVLDEIQKLYKNKSINKINKKISLFEKIINSFKNNINNIGK